MFDFPVKGSFTPAPNGHGEHQRDLKEIRLQAPQKSGPDYSVLYAMIPSHYQKVALLGPNDPSVTASRKRFGDTAGGAGMEWTAIKAKVQECYDLGKLKKWCATPEAAQEEADAIWKYFNSAYLTANS